MKDSISDVSTAGYDQITSDGNSTAVDRLGFEGVLFTGLVSTASTAGLRLEECDTVGGTYTDVATNQMYGDTGVIVFTNTFKVGYTGYKQFVRVVTDASADSVVDVVSIKRFPAHEAQA